MARKDAKDARKPGGDPATEAFEKGVEKVRAHPVFAPLMWRVRVYRRENTPYPHNGWATVSAGGAIYAHPKRRGSADEWAYAIAHCLLHLGLGHFKNVPEPIAWQSACDCFVARFLKDLKFGRPPDDMLVEVDFGSRSEERLYESFVRDGIPPQLAGCGAAGPSSYDMIDIGQMDTLEERNWEGTFAEGLLQAVDAAVELAAGLRVTMGSRERAQTEAARARSWFISRFPLLGSLAASFTLVEDPQVCIRMQIAVAAVDAEAQEIYVNPAARLYEEEARFVIAHELLHVGLRHQARRLGRDPFLWNVACDYVVNGWLVEMGVGNLPKFGVLYDPELKGMSAEGIYDLIVTDMRRYRKLATLRGTGLGDMLEGDTPEWWTHGDGMALDGFYRRCLSQGLAHHEAEGRGLLPSGLIEEIRALDQPPIPWDVELAQWFDRHFSPLEKRRTYTRLSRRQSSTPDIPRPLWVPLADSQEARTFGVVLDTSGSMDRKLLAKALGAIASYSLSREVGRVRLVFCDAVAYDEGYVAPEVIAERVRVRGRGGTILQPGIDLLEKAEDFPKAGPVLIITDGECDRLQIRREHAFLLPQGRHLPFVPKGPVFRIT
jgi:predicted metal-dependent peptidase